MERAPRVLLGVTGGIAAFKAVDVVRLLRREGAEVRCALTRAASAFVSPLTLEILCGHRVFDESYLEPSGQASRSDAVEEHIELAAWTDVLVIVPATANTLARLSLGLADDFLSTVALGFSGPLVVAPAMHEDMWNHPAVVENVDRLRDRGTVFVGPERGPLANGQVGEGRLAEPERVVSALLAACQLEQTEDLAGAQILVSAGPTQEPLDPVRFLSNRSSGKMGFALAEAAARRGASVTLVAGPVALATPPGVDRLDVTTALEMRDAVLSSAEGCDLAVLAAAVADFRPSAVAEEKIKKASGSFEVTWERNPDILKQLSKTFEGVLVGFAAETQNLLTEAQRKLEDKSLDFIVANDVSDRRIGFGSDQNRVTVLRRNATAVELPQAAKKALANELLDLFRVALVEKGALG